MSGEVPEGYRPLTVEEVPGYVRARPELSALAGEGPLTVREVGDGNLNLVFIVRSDPAVPGVVLKQSLPWVRVVGEGWPLTIERARHEADAFEVHGRFAGDAIPRYHGFDPVRYVHRIAPRELLVVAARQDRLFPPATVERYYALAGEPKKLLWTETSHVGNKTPDIVTVVLEVLSAYLDGESTAT